MALVLKYARDGIRTIVVVGLVIYQFVVHVRKRPNPGNTVDGNSLRF